MAKRKHRFLLGMAVYALVFLMLTAGGLWVFWQFLESYELSRPKTCVNDYLENLTTDHIRQECEGFLASLDGGIQTEDEAFSVIESALSEPVTAIKSGKSTGNQMVYILRSGEWNIGFITIVPGEPGDFDFAPWQLEKEEFDFSFLLSKEISITVPSEFTVCLNGNPLDEGYITQRDIVYPALEEFQGEFEMPTMVTYTAGNFLGELDFAVVDPEGNPVRILADTDMNQFLPVPSEEGTARVERLAKDFLNRYTVFCSNANAEQEDNFGWLNQLLVPGSGLSLRLSTAIDGLQYAQSISDRIQSTQINGIYQISEDRFFCDLTYHLLTYGQKGPVETDNNIKLVLLQTPWGLRVETMTRY